MRKRLGIPSKIPRTHGIFTGILALETRITQFFFRRRDIFRFHLKINKHSVHPKVVVGRVILLCAAFDLNCESKMKVKEPADLCLAPISHLQSIVESFIQLITLSIEFETASTQANRKLNRPDVATFIINQPQLVRGELIANRYYRQVTCRRGWPQVLNLKHGK